MNSIIADSKPAVLKLITNWSKFAKLKDACKVEIIEKLGSVHAMLNAKRGTKKAIALAEAKRRNVGKSTIYNELKAYNTKGWRGLINKSRFSNNNGKIPKQFKDQVIGMCEDCDRTDDHLEVRRQCLDKLAAWRRTGDSQFKLEGYSEPPKDNPSLGYPDGWSKRTFQRIYQDVYARTIAKQGRKAASNHLPPVLTTRQGLSFLERVYFDDQDYDNKIIVSGLPESVRPVGFNCLDHLTGAHLGYHLRVVTKTTDEQTYKALTGKEFTWFVLHQLQTVGFRTDEKKTTYIFEHGTANSWATIKTKKLSTFSGHYSFEDALHALTNGQVSIERSGKFNDPLYKDMLFRPSSSGNYKFKTWIESAFRLVRTYMQSLPAPTGRKYELAHEELYGLEKYEKSVLKACADLPEQMVEQIQHGMLTYIEFADILNAVYRAINSRTDHNLEAWELCNFIRPLWRMNKDSNLWFPREALSEVKDPEERAFLERRLAENPELTTTENLSPAEAVEQCRKDPAIATLGREATPLLIPKEWAITKKIKSNSTITLKDPFFKNVRHQYTTLAEDAYSFKDLKLGKEILCYYNPFDIDNLVICSMDGTYLGTLTRTIPRQSHNQEQTLIQLEERARLKSIREAAPRARAATLSQDRQHMKEVNDRLKQGDTRTAQERKSDGGKKAAQTRRNRKNVDLTDAAFDSLADEQEEVLPDLNF